MSYQWAVLVSQGTWKPTKFRHYVEAEQARGLTARCGMVRGRRLQLPDELFQVIRAKLTRKCRKCRVSEASDMKRGVA